jgi:hypothetical protein
MSYLKSPIRSARYAFMAGESGPIEPSPKICVVTPCRISPCERGSAISEVSECDSMLMKPGATASPVASMTLRAVAPWSAPTAATRSPRMATSARRGGPPVPS